MEIDELLNEMGIRCRFIPNFEEFINEKQGVISRIQYADPYVDGDANQISKIVDSFVEKIKKDPKKETLGSYPIFDDIISILYEPNKREGVNGECHKGQIYIYKEISDKNELEIKYTIVHEIVHFIQQKFTNVYKDFDDLDEKTKVRNLISHLEPKDIFSVYTKFMYINDRPELYAYCQNAYMYAFSEKMGHPTKPDSEIVESVLTKIKMRRGNLSLALSEVKRSPDAFACIVGVMVGQFNEIHPSNSQSYFDKSVFSIDVVKKMRKEVKNIMSIKDGLDYYGKSNMIVKLIYNNLSSLIEHKDEIIGSLSKGMTRWFEESQKRLGKSISLGIEDATEYIRKEDEK